MALKIVRLAAADYGNGRRRCPQADPAALYNPASELVTRGSRRKSYIPAVTAKTMKSRGQDIAEYQLDILIALVNIG